MRLIDIEKLPQGSMIRMVLRDEPVIEAIPIKWILQWSAEHMNEYGTYTVERMLEDWNRSSKS